MKRIVMLASAMLVTVMMNAQSGFGLLGGVNFSTSSTPDAQWRVGGYFGGLYDFQLTKDFYLQPRLLFSYQENQQPQFLTSSVTGNDFFSQWNVSLPVLASFRLRLSNTVGLRLNAGPYVQYAAFGRNKQSVIHGDGSHGTELGWWHSDFSDKLTYGGMAGIQIERGKWFGTFDYKHSFRRNSLNFGGFENTLQLGFGYKF